MGGYYDRLMAQKLPAGATLDAYRSAAASTDLSKAYDAARSAAGPEVLQTTLVIPIVLIVAFGGLVLYMRSRNKTQPLPTPAV